MNFKYHFYKGYYQGFDPREFSSSQINEKIADHNKKLFEKKNRILQVPVSQDQLDIIKIKQEDFGDNLFQFQLKTEYPGLISGVGYTHETGNVGEVKLGFQFDHTTGLPFIPGHTLKGVLRSVFPGNNTNETDAERSLKAQYISDLLNPEIGDLNPLEWVQKLMLYIFDATPIESKQRDIFLGANISSAAQGGVIFGLDAITPHDDKKWKNPIPLSFMKVMPGVTWEFSFMLHKSSINGVEVTAEQKCNLFKLILLDIGIGAKTNVGYGQFV